MNHRVWQPLLEVLPDWIEPQCIDLPGHGNRAGEDFVSLDELVTALAEINTAPALWVGWSLGGLVVAEFARRYPDKAKAVMLVSSTPCFIERPDWSCGMPESVFDQFAADMEADFSGTIQRFLALQVRGSDAGRQLLRQLRQYLLACQQPNQTALRAGLQVLKSTDLREQLAELRMPVYWLLGGRDTLVNVDLARELEKLNPHAGVTVIEKAAHAPFLSHIEEFCDSLTGFADTIDDFTPSF